MELKIENFKIMKDINKIVEQESFKVFPVVTNVKGGDCNKRHREDWVNACNKGVQIMKEMMESLKDFETCLVSLIEVAGKVRRLGSTPEALLLITTSRSRETL